MQISMEEISELISQQTLKIFYLEKQVAALQGQIKKQENPAVKTAPAQSKATDN